MKNNFSSYYKTLQIVKPEAVKKKIAKKQALYGLPAIHQGEIQIWSRSRLGEILDSVSEKSASTLLQEVEDVSDLVNDKLGVPLQELEDRHGLDKVLFNHENIVPRITTLQKAYQVYRIRGGQDPALAHKMEDLSTRMEVIDSVMSKAMKKFIS